MNWIYSIIIVYIFGKNSILEKSMRSLANILGVSLLSDSQSQALSP